MVKLSDNLEHKEVNLEALEDGLGEFLQNRECKSNIVIVRIGSADGETKEECTVHLQKE